MQGVVVEVGEILISLTKRSNHKAIIQIPDTIAEMCQIKWMSIKVLKIPIIHPLAILISDEAEVEGVELHFRKY